MSDDLISRQDLLNILEKDYNNMNVNDISGLGIAILTVKTQPVSYDVDKVIEKLEKKQQHWENEANSTNNAVDHCLCLQHAKKYVTAIKIVKAGGKDD